VDDLAVIDELELGQGQDTLAIERGLEREVEAGEGLDRGQGSHAQRRLDAAGLSHAQLLGEQRVDQLDGAGFAALELVLGTVANPRVHATTRRVVNEAFAEEKLVLQPLPLVPFRAVLKLERRVSHEGMVSVGGNFYSVPDATRKRVVEVHSLADEIRVFEADRLIAVHPVLEGRHQRRLAPGHRKMPTQRATAEGAEIPIGRAGDVVARRSLDFYDAVARRLAAESRQP
jgi:hypothetical protein